MKRGEKITIYRVPAGLYRIEREGQPTMIGGAASTAFVLNTLIFQDEACETPEYIKHKDRIA